MPSPASRAYRHTTHIPPACSHSCSPRLVNTIHALLSLSHAPLCSVETPWRSLPRGPQLPSHPHPRAASCRARSYHDCRPPPRPRECRCIRLDSGTSILRASAALSLVCSARVFCSHALCFARAPLTRALLTRARVSRRLQPTWAPQRAFGSRQCGRPTCRATRWPAA